MRPQVGGNAGAVGSSALDPDGQDRPEVQDEGQQVPVAGHRGGELTVTELLPDFIDDADVVGVLVGIDPSVHICRGSCHDGDCLFPLNWWGRDQSVGQTGR